MSGLRGPVPHRFVSVYDDMLQMIASLDSLDAGDDAVAADLASGLSPERQAFALSNLSRILVTLIHEDDDITKTAVYASVRDSVIEKIARAE